MTQIRTLIFDFDGTLADTLGIAIAEFRKLKIGNHATDDATIERLRGMTARQVLKTLGIRWWELPRVAYLARQTVSKHITQVKSFDGMQDVLERLHDQGLNMLIASSNSTKNIELFLQNNHMQDYFEHVYGGTGIFDKARALSKLVRRNNLKIEECLYIGDEVRDIEAARRAGMRSISVTWGYNNHKALEAAKPDTLVDRPEELLKLLVAKP